MSPRPFKSSRRGAFATGLLWLAGAGMMVGPVFAGQVISAPGGSAARGRALFTGEIPLTGRIREHNETMPPSVVTCGSCHAVGGQQKFARSDAPKLDIETLTERRSRRNGPVSAYDAVSFCRVLRTGTDPVSILVDHTMPLYAMTDADCASLWMFLHAPEAK